MTNEEAIKNIEWAKTHNVVNKNGEVYKAFCKAIEALEKQIPKKPKEELYDICGRPLKNKSDIHTRKNYACPNCGVSQKKFIPYTYCAKCGQKIDWR